MEENLLIFINKVYIDLLKKSNCNKEILRSIRLINRLIKGNYLKDSNVLARSVYEELMAELAIQSDPNFIIDIKTEPQEIREQVINNIDFLFKKDYIDNNVLRGLYNYLCKVTHESTLRRQLRDFANNKNFRFEVKCNIYLILCYISYIYLSFLYKDNDVLELVDKLLIIGVFYFLIAIAEFYKSLTPGEKNVSKSYFITSRDLNYINNIKTEFADTRILLKENNIDDDYIKTFLNNYFSDIDKLIDKYHYRESFNQIVLGK